MEKDISTGLHFYTTLIILSCQVFSFDTDHIPVYSDVLLSNSFARTDKLSARMKIICILQALCNYIKIPTSYQAVVKFITISSPHAMMLRNRSKGPELIGDNLSPSSWEWGCRWWVVGGGSWCVLRLKCVHRQITFCRL